METQKELIEKHLLEKGKITSWEAFKIYGVTRLSHIIYVLRRKYDIISVTKKIKNRYGYYCIYSEYTLNGNS